MIPLSGRTGQPGYTKLRGYTQPAVSGTVSVAFSGPAPLVGATTAYVVTAAGAPVGLYEVSSVSGRSVTLTLLAAVIAQGQQIASGAAILYAGNDGAAGNTILSGAGAPSNGTGSNGDFYINTSTTAIYGPKTSGSWPSGTSLVGASGTNGNTVLTTSGAPSNGTGVNGDFAYDPTAKIMYGPKSGGVWPAGVSLAGTNGTDATVTYAAVAAVTIMMLSVPVICSKNASAVSRAAGDYCRGIRGRFAGDCTVTGLDIYWKSAGSNETITGELWAYNGSSWVAAASGTVGPTNTTGLKIITFSSPYAATAGVQYYFTYYAPGGVQTVIAKSPYFSFTLPLLSNGFYIEAVDLYGSTHVLPTLSDSNAVPVLPRITVP